MAPMVAANAEAAAAAADAADANSVDDAGELPAAAAPTVVVVGVFPPGSGCWW